MPRQQPAKHDAGAAPRSAETMVPDEFWAHAFRLLAELDQLHVQIQRVLEIHPSEARALLAVWNEDGLSASDLARRIKLTAPAITALIDRLESRKLVERTKDPANKRYVIVKATPAAHDRLASIGSYLQARHDNAARRTAQQADRGIEPLRRLLDETITTMRLTPVEVFPASLDSAGNLPIRAFQVTDDT